MMPSSSSITYRRRAFTIGSSVPRLGTYICQTCETLQDFEVDEQFGECEVCLNERTKWKVARMDEFSKA